MSEVKDHIRKVDKEKILVLCAEKAPLVECIEWLVCCGIRGWKHIRGYYIKSVSSPWTRAGSVPSVQYQGSSGNPVVTSNGYTQDDFEAG